MKEELLNYEYPQTELPSLIKVIGVGGGGGNAVENMFENGILTGNSAENEGDTSVSKIVSFLLCNTDNQALSHSKIPNTFTLGPNTTHGLGAGNKPEKARAAAEESAEDLRLLLDDNNTRMVFVTAGMGGGTGTGAAPVVARIARELGILTVGIVTIPFLFEGRTKILQALNGVEEIRKNVDALLIINNEQLRLIYPELTLNNAFIKADETLLNAVWGISEIITRRGKLNLDFADVKTILENGGIAIISSGYGSGPERLKDAIKNAMTSPLLNNNNVFKPNRILLNLYQSSTHPILTEEIDALNEFMDKLDSPHEVIWGLANNEPLDEQIKITILASGFDISTTRESILELGDGKKIKDPIAIREQEEREQSETALFESFYGSDKLVQAASKPVILTLDELDNDEIIIELERTPTLTRSMQNIDEIRRRIAGSTLAAKDPGYTIASDTGHKIEEQNPNVIRF